MAALDRGHGAQREIETARAALTVPPPDANSGS